MLLWFVAHFSVNVPFGDDWELIPLFEKVATGTVRVQDLFAPHSEHRMVFPRLLFLAIAFGSHWNLQVELCLNIFLAMLTFLAIACLARQQTAGGYHRALHLANLLSCGFLFSWVQWENWLWGFQIAWVFNQCLCCRCHFCPGLSLPGAANIENYCRCDLMRDCQLFFRPWTAVLVSSDTLAVELGSINPEAKSEATWGARVTGSQWFTDPDCAPSIPPIVGLVRALPHLCMALLPGVPFTLGTSQFVLCAANPLGGG
ncbi:hypothetical protein DO97_13305 [Neosynechococcus sphagnicola sy1]|uniref:Uncharacterized protein n=2 Tax=Neosynechococcus TaxID=1501143 RepID=A0A098TJ36_9CYAN|nr:hypothetical protein DO97_13305 [Neosynechococcus sphagnicola sy1]